MQEGWEVGCGVVVVVVGGGVALDLPRVTGFYLRW